ncbi:hypothetical protein SAMN05421786_103354 [Chryseobacterium ureilyticum]|uniref:Uncharacterized protein n=1 Tax=Chryseobacterium ureilyticum TaxID=373668 RepID=A0A1N7NAN6_9FLAO|nr:hypothetical protein SAMN05421786_103354 [Chryseobacterium ureilyticum]
MQIYKNIPIGIFYFKIESEYLIRTQTYCIGIFEFYAKVAFRVISKLKAALTGHPSSAILANF